MINISKYKIQLTIVLIVFLLLAFGWRFYSVKADIEYLELFVEGVIALSCLFLMFWIEHLNLENSRHIYWLLLVSSSFLFIGHILDASDELTAELALLDFMEDVFKPAGFLLFIYANFRWVELHQQQSRLMSRLAETDPLTGVMNRRAFMEKGNLTLQRSALNGNKVSAIMIDVDYFKRVNDNCGHQFGDQVLVEIAVAIQSKLRRSDYLARVGGEEFAVLLYDVDSENVKRVAERIRTCVESLKITYKQQEVKCTVSLGLAIDHGREGGLEMLIQQADKALYEAKVQGRNCWQMAH